MAKIEGTSGKSVLKSSQASSRLPAARGRGKISQKVKESTSGIKPLHPDNGERNRSLDSFHGFDLVNA